KTSTSINSISNPWNNAINSINESESSTNELDKYNCDMELSFNNCEDLIYSRNIELEEDKKMFESLINIIADNIQNDNFYNTYKRLRQTLIKETKACQEALTAQTQQKTWNPPCNSKLAFLLN
ncbi:28647_t:CDS:1, partial [Dentiscutata erythropus]